MDAKTVVGYVLIGAALGLVFFVFFLLNTGGDDADEAVPWTHGVSFSGRVVELGDDHLHLEVKANEQRDFRLDGGTRWSVVRNRPVAPGDRVRVICRELRTGSVLQYRVRKVVAVPEPSPSASPLADASGAPGASPSARACPSGGPGIGAKASPDGSPRPASPSPVAGSPSPVASPVP